MMLDLNRVLTPDQQRLAALIDAMFIYKELKEEYESDDRLIHDPCGDLEDTYRRELTDRLDVAMSLFRGICR